MSSDNPRASLISGEEIPPRPKGDVERVHAVVRRRIGGPGKRVVIGVVEEVLVRGPSGGIRVLAKIDTGAARTSLDTDLAKRAGLGPVMDRVRIRAAAAEKPEERDVVSARLVIRGKEFRAAVAVTDRKDMRYRMIVGMDVLRGSGFLIDPRHGPADANGEAARAGR